MLSRITLFLSLSSLAALAALGIASPLQAQDAEAAAWRVSKSSGNVWLMTTGAQHASLGARVQLKPGDSIRTGSNGRVLLERGKESILITPNSALTIPATQTDPASTTIIQQSGSIQLQVEKRNVRNFEVETPFLVAAVKGTEFTVTVNKLDASVQVSGGSVEVTTSRPATTRWSRLARPRRSRARGREDCRSRVPAHSTRSSTAHRVRRRHSR